MISSRAYDHTDRVACLSVFDSNVPHFFRVEERPEFEAFLDEPPGPYIVLVDEAGAVVGCGGYAVRMSDGEADLCWGMVRSERHGHGLGRALTEWRLAAARHDPDVRSVRLDTSQHTTGFYERLGFEVVSVVEDGYAPGLDKCEMRLVLAEG